MEHKNATILIVEDEADVLNVNARMLKRKGYNVITATTAKESLIHLSECTPDMLILDIMLPDGNGYDICKKFKYNIYSWTNSFIC